MNNLRTPPPLSSCKNLPPYFFMVHLLHRLYGVDAPGHCHSEKSRSVSLARTRNCSADANRAEFEACAGRDSVQPAYLLTPHVQTTPLTRF